MTHMVDRMGHLRFRMTLQHCSKLSQNTVYSHVECSVLDGPPHPRRGMISDEWLSETLKEVDRSQGCLPTVRTAETVSPHSKGTSEAQHCLYCNIMKSPPPSMWGTRTPFTSKPPTQSNQQVSWLHTVDSMRDAAFQEPPSSPCLGGLAMGCSITLVQPF